MKKLNKKADSEANLEWIGKYILWIVIAIIAALAVTYAMNTFSTGI